MSKQDRKLFWDTLNGLYENSQECWDKLRAVYKPPEMLCRFRSVNKVNQFSYKVNLLH